jgi:HlyD family secretion protein
MRQQELAQSLYRARVFPYSRPVDITRTPPPRRRRYFVIALAMVAVASVTVAVSRLESRAPSVERGTLWIDTVRRGTMLRQVRAPGKLEPEHVRFVAALTAGRVMFRPVCHADRR